MNLIKACRYPGNFSPSFSELQRNFVKHQPTKLKSLLRLVNHWYQQVRGSGRTRAGRRGKGKARYHPRKLLQGETGGAKEGETARLFKLWSETFSEEKGKGERGGGRETETEKRERKVAIVQCFDSQALEMFWFLSNMS